MFVLFHGNVYGATIAATGFVQPVNVAQTQVVNIIFVL